MQLQAAPLEDWMRRYYFDAPIDLGSSGVEPFGFGELRTRLGISVEELDDVAFHDSQTLGGHGLRQAIADRWGTGDRDMVMATAGSNEALFLLMHALLKPGDTVLALDPCYQQLYGVAEAIGCRIVRWPLRAPRFHADLDDLAAIVARERITLAVLNFPTNPTGTQLTMAECETVTRLLAAAGSWLVWDLAFIDLTDRPDVRAGELLAYPRAITTGTLSKAFGLPGLRVGWALAQPDVWDACMRMRDYTTLHLSPLIELVAERAVRRAEDLLVVRLAQARANRALLIDWIAQHADHLRGDVPADGVCAFPELTRMIDTRAFCEAAARRGVLLVPGDCFGFPRHVRLGFGAATADMREGLARLSPLLRERD